MLVGAADANLGTARISQQEVGKRIARPLTVEREVSPGIDRIDRIECKVKQVAAEFHSVVSLFVHHVVVQLVTAIVTRHERRGISDRAEESAKGHLRVPHIGGIPGHALQPRLLGEVDTLVGAHLSAAGAQIAKPNLVQPSSAEGARVTDRDVLAVSRHRSAKARDQCFIQRRRPERLGIIHAVGSHARTGYRSPQDGDRV